jgi:CHAT domain
MADRIPDYDELSLRIDPGPDGYQVIAWAPDGARASGSFNRPISPEELQRFIGDLTRGVRGYSSPELDSVKELGLALFHSLLDGDVGDVYQWARRTADSNHRGLRISLSMTKAPELLELPWELIYDPGRRSFLAQSIFSPVVRSLDNPIPRAPLPAEFPLRVLAVASSPRGFQQLDVALERAKLEKALCPIVRAGQVRLEWLETATFSELERRIGAPDELHVVHYVGHGAFDERTRGGILLFEDESGAAREVTGDDLAACMSDERSLRLVVLNSCEGTRSSHVDPFSGVAQSLLGSGLPAVVGMQAEITDKAAVTFADRLYTALAQGYPIDAALSNARKAIFTSPRKVEFGTPVLFMNVPDGRIFELSSAKPPTPVDPLELSLRPEPASVREGGTVSWHLRIRNTDCAPLTEVTARDRTGETRVVPAELPVGATADAIWTTTVNGRGGDEAVTVTARNSDDEVVDARARAAMEVVRRPWWPPSGRLAAGVGAALVALLAAVLALSVLGGGDDEDGGGGGGGGGGPDVKVFNADADVRDLDARADKIAFLAPAGDGKEVRRLDPVAWKAEQVAPPAPDYKGIDMGNDGADHGVLVYSRCDEADRCDLFRDSFTDEPVMLAASTPECNEGRPTMWRGSVLYARGGGCPDELWLDPSGPPPPRRVTGATGGADLNDGTVVWISGGVLTAGSVSADGTVDSKTTLKAPSGEVFHPPIVIEDEYVYFVHNPGSENFIVRTRVPFDGSGLERYAPGGGAEESPHFAVTGTTLYTTNYPQPDGEPGSRVIVRVREAEFELAE